MNQIYKHRHFTVAFVISAAFPIVGTVLVLGAGLLWEWITHGRKIPDDQDTKSDLMEDFWGAILGMAVGLPIALLGWHPLV